MDSTPRDQDQVEGRGRTLEEVRDWTNRFYALVRDTSHHRRQVVLHSQAHILVTRDGVIGADNRLEDRGEQLGKAASNLSCELSDKLLRVVEVVAPELVEALVTVGECLDRLRRADGTVEVRDARKVVSDLYFLLAQTPETLPEMAQAREPEPTEQDPPVTSGHVGRPNVTRLCFPELRRRAESDEMLKSGRAESRVLRQWMQKTYPDKKVTAKAIENEIRDEHRRLRDLQ